MLPDFEHVISMPRSRCAPRAEAPHQRLAAPATGCRRRCYTRGPLPTTDLAEASSQLAWTCWRYQLAAQVAGSDDAQASDLLPASVCCTLAGSDSDIPFRHAGEGFYLGHLLRRLHGQGRAASLYGVDVSKLAVRLAAARHKAAAFAVASSYRLPFESQARLAPA